MFCKECGAEIPDDSKHCKECGVKLVENAPKKEKKKKSSSNVEKLFFCVIGIVIIFGVIMFLTSGNDADISNNTDDFYYTHGLKELGFAPYKLAVHDDFNMTFYKSTTNSTHISIITGDKYLSSDVKYGKYEPTTINGIDGYVDKDNSKFIVELANGSYVRFDDSDSQPIGLDKLVIDYWS